MKPDPEVIQTLSERIETLTRSLSVTERQVRQLECRVLGWRAAATVTGALLILALGIVAGTAISATEPPAQSATATTGPGHKPFRPVRQGFDDLHDLIEREREKMAASKDLDPAHAIAIFLYDVKEAMAVMPDIAADMKEMNAKMGAVPVMAAEMQQMKIQMGIMSRSVNSTMGRMGSMFPWAP
ncbi:MAG: hypothetical protein U9R74_13835 [Pseudomonadota bacterium]|nr:hypothetical protein [Pseudomonadota bacterium]